MPAGVIAKVGARLPAGSGRFARSGPAFELLESKLLPPRGHDGTVPRAGLIDRIERSQSVPVVVLSAGPGWGKSTLLAQWAAVSERPFAWVDVDENDNDPILLLTYMAVALDRVAPLDPGVFDALGSPGVSVDETVVRLGTAMATTDKRVVLALDDLHLIDSPACLDAVAGLAGYVSERSQLALSARGVPTVLLEDVRARGLALEIGPGERAVGRGWGGAARRAAHRADKEDGGLVGGFVSGGVVDQGAWAAGGGCGHVLGE